MKTELTIQRMSNSAKARCTDEWRKHKSELFRTKIDDAKLIEFHLQGKTQAECAVALSVGRKVIENAIKRLGLNPHKAIKRDQWGEKNVLWKGDSASLVNKHRRLYRAFGQPCKCDVCGTDDPFKSYDWANLTGDYSNPLDFKRMCRSCHWKYDSKYLNFKGQKGGIKKRGTRVLEK